jgi:hypothetical protein
LVPVTVALTGLSPAGTRPEPTLLSVFPMGGNPGTEFAAELRGTALKGAYAVQFDTEKLSADIERVEPAEPAAEGEKSKQEASKRKYKAVLRLRIQDSAEAGLHWMRLLTPNGLTDALRFRVNRDPVIAEVRTMHSRPESAQPLDEFPVVVNARFSRKAEADYYEFSVSAGERLRFEAYSGSPATDPVLTLFAPTGSWHNPARLSRLAYNDEPTHYPDRSKEPRIAYRFREAGRYLLRVEPFLGGGGPDHVDQLRVLRPAADQGAEKHRTRYFSKQAVPPLWEERSFTRPLHPDALEVLWSRSAARPDEEVRREIAVSNADSESANSQPVGVSLPAVIEGAVESPGDIDRVRFEAKRGDGVAIEIETPDAGPPDFNPYFRVLDEAGVEVFSNVHSMVHANGGFIMKTLQPKTIFNFLRDGTFTLEIRDVTTQYGDDRFAYRILIRPQVPHVGAVHIDEDRLNLAAGEIHKLSIVTDQEEGFDGYVALTVEDLPNGVKAIPATEVEFLRVMQPRLSEGKVERYVAKNRTATLLLATDADAPPTRTPNTMRVLATPVRKGEMGRPIVVKEMPVMVLSPNKETDPPDVTGPSATR